MAPGIDEKNMVFAPNNACFSPYLPRFSGVDGRTLSLGFEGGVAAKSVGSVC